MTPEDEQSREVYALYGLAAYCAQCFEKGLANFLLIHARATNTVVSVAAYDDLEQALHKKTMGMLLKEVGAVVALDPDSERLVDTALEKRNFLAHHYFWDRASDALSSEGRTRMIAELDELRDIFQQADSVTKVLCRATAEAVGLNWEVIEQEFERLLNEAQGHT